MIHVRHRHAAIAAATLALAASFAAPAAGANTIQSPSYPDQLGGTPPAVTAQVREDSSNLPVVWVGSALDFPGINTRARSYFEKNGLRFFEWAPLAVTATDPNVGVFDHINKYTPSLNAYIDDVLRQTGAPKVNLVTFSQGGLISAVWQRQGNNASKVDKVVNISGLVHGSPAAQLANQLLPGGCLGIGTCQDLDPNSDVIHFITNPTEALPGIEYLNIDSRADIVAGPYTNNLMFGDGDYQNVLIEDMCPFQQVDHPLMGFHHAVHEMIVQFFRGQDVKPHCIP
ncbi:hypothetical protein C3B44_07700 [Corynebacterium yudongzhengii]|uniref:Triacylglycerol lipase n=1 Tax=Corynebacterium yudongzhengii TaxID=2080740 RepID=A0A2U1T6Q9_9CORY|nr:hypothetical protein [Corynebacterium yudongzhengii]AWB82252.1 hypothetical protein C3B44_07700 [Corynebacterium yudongzhengii]PWC01701.1 hypothetical protein DF222_06220 [Corynebacterium yudongzhengii]